MSKRGLYRIRHIPTGQYVTKSGSWVSLSVRGKVYKNKGPISKWINLRWCKTINDYSELEWEEIVTNPTKFQEMESILRDFLTTKECRTTWIEEMHGTIEAVLNER